MTNLRWAAAKSCGFSWRKAETAEVKDFREAGGCAVDAEKCFMIASSREAAGGWAADAVDKSVIVKFVSLWSSLILAFESKSRILGVFSAVFPPPPNSSLTEIALRCCDLAAGSSALESESEEVGPARMDWRRDRAM